MLRLLFAAILLPLAASIPLLAGPHLELDKKTFDVGEVYEGTTKKVNAVFTITNSGDSTLRFSEVLANCGCTVVKFDSTVAPGGVSRLTAVVDVAGFRSGVLNKAVTIVSNAPNDSIVRLIIKGSLVAPIDPSTTFIEMTADRKYLLQLTTKKTDLKITDVTFTPFSDNPEAAAKKTLSVKHSLLRPDSVRTDGFTGYILELGPLTVDSTTTGAIAVFSNHPDKKEMRIRGKVTK